MKISKFFSCPVFIFKLDLNHKKIQKKCLHVRDSRPPDTSRSNVGGYRSDQINPDDPVFSKLIRNINTNLKEVSLNHMGFIRETKMSSIWFCINKHRDFNKEHIHPFSILSGVYYVKVPKNSGNLFLINPYYWNTKKIRPSYHTKYRFESKNLEIEFPVVEGDLYFFNGCVPHRVGKNLTSDDRISVSFNFVYDRIHEKLYGYEKLPWEVK